MSSAVELSLQEAFAAAAAAGGDVLGAQLVAPASPQAALNAIVRAAQSAQKLVNHLAIAAAEIERDATARASCGAS